MNYLLSQEKKRKVDNDYAGCENKTGSRQASEGYYNVNLSNNFYPTAQKSHSVKNGFLRTKLVINNFLNYMQIFVFEWSIRWKINARWRASFIFFHYLSVSFTGTSDGNFIKFSAAIFPRFLNLLILCAYFRMNITTICPVVLFFFSPTHPFM